MRMVTGNNQKHKSIKVAIMNNRQKVKAAIVVLNDNAINSEIDYLLAQEHDYVFDEADALNDILDLAEYNKDRSLIRKCRIILIEAGGFCLAPVNNTVMGSDTRFQLNGKKYDWPHYGGWETWLGK